MSNYTRYTPSRKFLKRRSRSINYAVYGNFETEKNHELYIQEKKAYNESEAGKQNLIERLAKRENYNTVIQPELDKLYDDTIKLENKIYTEIINELNAYSNPTFNDIDNIINNHVDEIKKLAELSNNPRIFEKRPSQKFLPINKLFHDLTLVNIKFAVHSPVEVLYRNWKFEKLPLNERLSEYKPRFEQRGLFNNKKFATVHANKFRDITQINNLLVIKDILKLNPELYSKVNTDVKKELYYYPSTLLELVRSNTNLIRYMTKKEIYLMTKENFIMFRHALIVNPALIEILPDDYFTKNNPKIFFSSMTKQAKIKFFSQLSDAAKEKFPELIPAFARYTETEAGNSAETDNIVTTEDLLV